MTMRNAALSALALLATAGSASAHHAFNMYDNEKYLPLTGTVKSFSWHNPHAMLELMIPVTATAPDQARTDELSAPNIIGRRGWTRDSLKVGQTVPLTIHPMKDGTKYGLMVSVTVNGQVLTDKA